VTCGAVDYAVCFKARLEACGRFMVPKQVRWRFRLEPSYVLKVMVHPLEPRFWSEELYGRMDKRGRVTMPKLLRGLLRDKAGDCQSVAGMVVR
jgi:bifunctional DNA-binding transcriptional regulator/antitoxin component of YhaV-PrlF toxin-antitoxin module